MPHPSPSRTARRAPPVTPALLSLTGGRRRLRTALADKRAAVSGLQAAWVAAAETDATRGTGRDVRVDDRATWDGTIWHRYLAAASRHEPDFMPRIKRLLGEIANIERLLALSPTPTRPGRLDKR